MVFYETFVLPSLDDGHVTEMYGNNCIIIQIKFMTWYTETPCNRLHDQVDQIYTSSVMLTDIPVRFVLFPFEHGNEHSGSIQEAGSLMTS
jgi:hypothetical protein